VERPGVARIRRRPSRVWTAHPTPDPDAGSVRTTTARTPGTEPTVRDFRSLWVRFVCGAAGERGRVSGPGLYLCPRQRATRAAVTPMRSALRSAKARRRGGGAAIPASLPPTKRGRGQAPLRRGGVGTPLPAMDPGVLAAFDDFNNWFVQAKGTANAALEVTAALTSGAATSPQRTDQIHVQFAGSLSPSPA